MPGINLRVALAQKPLLLDRVPRALKAEAIDILLAGGHIVECPGCGGLSAYAWGDVDEARGVAHVGAASSWEWECGHCHTYWMERDSPIDHEAYTHRAAQDDDDE